MWKGWRVIGAAAPAPWTTIVEGVISGAANAGEGRAVRVRATSVAAAVGRRTASVARRCGRGRSEGTGGTSGTGGGGETGAGGAGLQPVGLDELEPDFAAGGEGGHSVDERPQRHLAHDGDRGGLEEVRHLHSHEGGAGEDLARGIDDEAGLAGGVVAEEAGTGGARDL